MAALFDVLSVKDDYRYLNVPRIIKLKSADNGDYIRKRTEAVKKYIS